MQDFQQLYKYLKKLYKTMTLREIADGVYGGKVSHGTIHRCLAGHEPKDNGIRKALDLPLIVTQYKDPQSGRFIEK